MCAIIARIAARLRRRPPRPPRIDIQITSEGARLLRAAIDQNLQERVRRHPSPPADSIRADPPKAEPDP